jgi:hypothetical protein
MIDILLTHAVARREGKPPFFFSRFNFDRMKEAGNTHFCFHCGGSGGFRRNEDGTASNIVAEDKYLIGRHNATHDDAVIKNADKYDNPWNWLKAEISSSFPYIVTIPSIN